MKLDADNLEVDLIKGYSPVAPDEDQHLSIEPQYIGFLRSNKYPIREVTDLRVIASESDSEAAHLVCKVHTLEYPRGHKNLDYEAHKTVLPVCDCWAFRENSANLNDGEKPSESTGCKHTRKAYRTEKAADDDSQATL